MGKEDKLEQERAERRQKFLNWDIEKELPSDIEGYKLKRLDRQEGRIYFAFCWENEKNGWQVRALFDEETMDYMVKSDLRMMTLTEIELITGDFEEFKRNMKLLTPRYIARNWCIGKMYRCWCGERGSWCGITVSSSRPSSATMKGLSNRPVLSWGSMAPILSRPMNAGKRKQASFFFYNVYRDEYYGELRAKGIPGIIHQYDAKTIQDLEETIKPIWKRT